MTTVLGKKDFEVFQKAVQKWVSYFGLTDWEVHTSFEEDDPTARGSCGISEPNARVCVISLNRDWGEFPVASGDIDKVAFHEVCELLLMPIRWAMCRADIGEKTADEKIHRVIRILENTVWRDSRRRSPGR